MAQNLWIEAETFCGMTIFGAKQPPYGYGLEHVHDINTGKNYTVIMKVDKNYSYEERQDGSLIYAF